MSSYLNFYLVPKDSDKPLLLMSYSRSSDIYQAYYNTLHPCYTNSNETEYTELTKESNYKVIQEIKELLKSNKDNYELKQRLIKDINNPSLEVLEDLLEELSFSKKGIEDTEQTLHVLEFISTILDGLEYSEFTKLLINIS